MRYLRNFPPNSPPINDIILECLSPLTLHWIFYPHQSINHTLGLFFLFFLSFRGWSRADKCCLQFILHNTFKKTAIINTCCIGEKSVYSLKVELILEIAQLLHVDEFEIWLFSFLLWPVFKSFILILSSFSWLLRYQRNYRIFDYDISRHFLFKCWIIFCHFLFVGMLG